MAPATLSPRRTRALGGDDDDVPRRLARAVAKRHRLVELPGEAVVFREAIGDVAVRDFDAPLLHPDLLMNAHVARAGLVGHSRSGGQNDLDDANRRRKVRRRNVAPDISGLRIAPRRPILAPGHQARGRARIVEERCERHAESRGDLLQYDRSRTAFATLDQRDHRAADFTLRGERIEGHAEVRPQRSYSARDARVDVPRDRFGSPVLHTGRIVQYGGWTVN